MNRFKEKWKEGVKLPAWAVALVLCLAAVVIGVMCTAIQPGSFLQTLRVYMDDPLLFALNGFPVCVLVLLFWAIFANPFYAAAAAGLLINLLSYVNLVKTDCRSDPFVPDDIFLMREALDATGSYSLDLHWGVLIGLIAFSLVCVLAGTFFRSEKPKWFWRVGCGAVVIAAFIFSMMTVYPDKEIYEYRANAMDKSNVPKVFEKCGFVYCFLHNYRLYEVEKPDGYSASEVAQWAQTDENELPQMLPNVIFVMCEAFSDLSEQEVFAYTEENDPLAGYKAVASRENAVSGHLIVSNFGAGTANTEFDILTGIQTNMLAEGTTSAFRTVHRNLNSLPRAFAAAGYQTYFMHPGKAWFYNRESVYDYLGISDSVFEEAFTKEDFKGDYISDAAFLEQLKQDLSQRMRSDEPIFAYTVTIQNHQAYPYSKYGFEPPDAPVHCDLTDAQTETLAVYMEGIRDSSEMVLALADYLDTLDEPTVLVFFGDHLPALLADYGVYRALGMDIGKTDTIEQVLATYQTPYLIYANEAYGDAFDPAELDIAERFSSTYLGALVYETVGLNGIDPYFDELTQLRRELPVICHGCYVLGDGTMTREPTQRIDEILWRLDCWKYYRMKDENLIAR